MPTRVFQTKFWAISQNNSGGSFDHDPEKGIGYIICVEALDEKDAEHRLRAIIGGYPASYDCPCCGPRWSIWFCGDDGSDEPEKYGEPLTGGWGIPSYIHYLDGTIEAREDSSNG